MSVDPQISGKEFEYRAPDGFLTNAPISSALRVGDTIFLSGQIGIDEKGAVVPGGIGGQTRACLEKIGDILATYGASMSDVVQTRIFLTDLAGYADFNLVYQEFFSAPFPTRSTIGTPGLALGAGVEVEAVAVLRRGGR